MWIWLGGILILLLLVAALILLSKISIQLTALKNNQDDTIMLDVKMLYGLISIHYQVPSIILKNWKDGLLVEQDRSDNVFKGHTSSNERSIDKNKVNTFFKDLRQLLRSTKGFNKWMLRTLRRLTFRNLEWSTTIALPNAAHTATLTGALWGLKASLVGWLTCYIRLTKRPKLFVVPEFGGKPLFSTEIRCIAEIRCGYAIYAGLVLIVRVLKVKGGVKKWWTILFKD